jgi:DNA repair protein RadC
MELENRGKEEELKGVGHRSRLRERFLEDEGLSMPDYEILELMIMGVVRRGDGKPLAKRLLKTFGSFAGVLSADASDLLRVKGCGDAVAVALKVSHVSMERFLRSQVYHGHVVRNWDMLLQYLGVSMGWKREESLRLLLLDDSRYVVYDEKIAKGTVNEIFLYHREVVKKLVEMRATGVILIHNHPSGQVQPSEADLQTTHDLRSVLRVLGAELFDHLIVSGKEVYSFRNQGVLEL